MPIYTGRKTRTVCPKCNWKGPYNETDVIIGAIECPKCGTKTTLESKKSRFPFF